MTNNDPVALDLGFGQCKGKSASKQVKMPSYTAKVSTALMANTSQIIADKTGNWLAGHDAIANGHAKTPDVDSSWYQTTEYRILATKLLQELGNLNKVDLVTGLPIAHMERHQSALKSEIHSWKTYGLKINVKRIVPQPIGTLFAVAYDKDMRAVDGFGGKVGIVDIGRGTIDAVEINKHQLNKSSYASTHEGVSRVYVALQNEISIKHSTHIPLAEIPELFITGQFIKKGRPVDLTTAIKSAKKATLAPLARVIEDMWGNQNTLSKLVITGGGAALLRDELKATYHKDQLVIPDDPDMSNVTGYLRIAQDT